MSERGETLIEDDGGVDLLVGRDLCPFGAEALRAESSRADAEVRVVLREGEPDHRVARVSRAPGQTETRFEARPMGLKGASFTALPRKDQCSRQAVHGVDFGEIDR